MNYLWDRSDPIDPEIARLEKLLAPLGDPGTPLRPRRHRSRLWPYYLALAASLAVAGFFTLRQSPTRPTDWIDTSARDVELSIPSMGTVQLARGSRVRVASRAPENYRLELEQGKLEAFIYAPPRRFSVDTPSAVAVDLGCAYTLEVTPSGESLVSVRTGWVAFEREGRESFIPAGARCRTSRRFGLGIPYFNDAPAPLRLAIARFEENGSFPDWRVEARSRDAVTFWHLLARTRQPEAYDRLASLIRVPAQVSRPAALRGDRDTLNALWDALELGESGFWRRWQRPL